MNIRNQVELLHYDNFVGTTDSKRGVEWSLNSICSKQNHQARSSKLRI